MANSPCIMPQNSELESPSPGSSMQKMKRTLGIVLFLLSFVFYGCLALVPFATISAGSKLALSSALVICGEASFWISVLILGEETASRFRSADQIKKLLKELHKRFGTCRDQNDEKDADSMHEERKG